MKFSIGLSSLSLLGLIGMLRNVNGRDKVMIIKNGRDKTVTVSQLTKTRQDSQSLICLNRWPLLSLLRLVSKLWFDHFVVEQKSKKATTHKLILGWQWQKCMACSVCWRIDI